jgi:hypothetical protein
VLDSVDLGPVVRQNIMVVRSFGRNYSPHGKQEAERERERERERLRTT